MKRPAHDTPDGAGPSRNILYRHRYRHPNVGVRSLPPGTTTLPALTFLVRSRQLVIGDADLESLPPTVAGSMTTSGVLHLVRGLPPLTGWVTEATPLSP
jgi:hypothetical protein